MNKKLSTVRIDITNCCNLKCVHCYVCTNFNKLIKILQQEYLNKKVLGLIRYLVYLIKLEKVSSSGKVIHPLLMHCQSIT